jgi:diacylglycerol kinase family enzyme
MTQLEPQLSRFDLRNPERVVTILNPNATNSSEYSTYAELFKERVTNGIAPIIIESEPVTADTIDKLANNLRDGDLVYIAGGDGLGNDVAQFFARTDAPETVAMFSPIGGAKNNYHATIDPWYGGDPWKILQYGRANYAYPIRARIEGATDYERVAMSIIDIGAIAVGAAVLNDPTYRQHRLRQNKHTRLAYETYLSLCKAVPASRTLEISDLDDTNVRSALSLFVVNTPLVAKVARFATDLTDHDYLLGSIKDKRLDHTIPAMVRLVRGTMSLQRVVANDTSTAFKLTGSHKNVGALADFDGETVELLPDSMVRIDQPGHDDSRHHPFPVVVAV